MATLSRPPSFSIDFLKNGRKVSFQSSQGSEGSKDEFERQLSPSPWYGALCFSPQSDVRQLEESKPVRRRRPGTRKTMSARTRKKSSSSDDIPGMTLKSNMSLKQSHSGDAPLNSSRGSSARSPETPILEVDIKKHKVESRLTLVDIDFIKASIRRHRVRALLQDPDIEMIAQKMQYFHFDAEEVIAAEGEAETHFFVVHTGSLRLFGDGREDTLQPGRAFGSSALLYRCAWQGTIIATESCGLWGIDGDFFREVLRQRAQSRNRDSHRFLDSMQLFDGLSVEQRDLIIRAFEPAVFEAGSKVVSKGRVSEPAMYFVKTGHLHLFEMNKKLRPGDCFGEQVLMSDEAWPSTVIALERCELLRIQAAQLRPVLSNTELRLTGADPSARHLRELLEQSIVISAFRCSPICSHYIKAHQEKIAQNFEIIDYAPDLEVGSDVLFVVVITGVLVGSRDGAVKKVTLARGEWYSRWSEDLKLEAGHTQNHSHVPLRQAAAGSQGARLGILTKDSLVEALADNLAGGLANATAEEAMDYTRKLLVVRKIPLLRALTQEQTSNLVKKFKHESHRKGTCIIEQGSQGTTFFVIIRGEVVVTINGQQVRTMGTNGYFGERALLFDEPRTATVKISSCDADLWSLDKTTFAEVVTEKMREELMRRIRLQDTKVSLKDLRVVKSIGEGSVGLVKLVEHRETGMRYALKSMCKQNEKIIEEIERECALLRENDHPFVMDVVKTFETDSHIYMLTELLTGGDMHGAIRSIPTTLTRAQAQFYTGSLVIVLEALWDRRIVYRDLKPENVMLDAMGYIKLIDFGISKKLGEEPRTFTTVGTPHYMAPEVMSAKGYGTSADLWSLGVIFFEFVCGCLPFADDLEMAAEVFTAVLKGTFTIPDAYRDQGGRELIKNLLCYDPTLRLGAGINGYEELKAAPFFRLQDDDLDSMLFNKIMGRELIAPVVPQGEVFCEQDVDETDSDADSQVTDISEDAAINRSKSGRFERITPRRSEPLNNSAYSSFSSCCPCFAFLNRGGESDEEEDD